MRNTILTTLSIALLGLALSLYAFDRSPDAYKPDVKIWNSSPGRSLSTTGSNNTFTVHSTKDAWVSYTVSFSVSLLAALSNGGVDLDYSLNGGSTWVNVARGSQVFGVAITITTSQETTVSGMIPAGALVRINRASNTNVTISITRQQEVTF